MKKSNNRLLCGGSVAYKESADTARLERDRGQVRCRDASRSSSVCQRRWTVR